MLKQHRQFFKSLMLLNDLFFLSLAWWLSYLARFHSAVFPAPEPYVFQHYLVAWFLILVTWGSVFVFLDLYRPRRISTHLREIADIFKGSCLAVLIFFGVIFIIREIALSRIVVILFWLLSLVLINLSHVGFREGLRFLRRRGYNLRHVVVIGSSLQAKQLIDKLEWYRHLGLGVVGVYLTPDDDSRVGIEENKLLRNRQDLLRLVRSGGIDQVFITLRLEDAAKLREIRNWLENEPVTIYFVPDLTELRILGGSVEEFEGLHIISLQDSPLYGWNSFLKRVVDLSLGGLALFIFSPLMALISIGIRLSSTGAVFYRQERMGLDGKRFEMLKFRTMVEDAEKSTGPVWAVPDDARVTFLGRLLRRASLDELPQLINVLKGEMSLVGPRPERPPLIEEFRKSIPRYMLRHKVKAGMTGWAQVNGWRGNTSLEKRIEHDLYYIQNWSFWCDLKILALTLFRGFLNKNAA